MQGQPPLGRCPSCDAAVPEHALLIRYERDGWPAIYAECPACDSVVHPN